MNITELLTFENLHNSLRIGAFSIGLAFILDLLIGDPGWLPHPVRLIGCFVSKLEYFLRKVFKGSIAESVGGILLVLIVLGTTFLLTSIISLILVSSSPTDSFKPLSITEFLASLFFVFLVSTTLATKSLLVSVRDVISKVKDGNIVEARRSLSMIVGRDTDHFNNEGILRAGLESLSENLSDGVVAPLFYLTIGGLPLAMTYKAINTMDSMIGYKNERYRYFGWAAARLDDLLNYIPARLTSLFILLAVFFFETGKGIHSFFKEAIFSKPKPLRRLVILFTLFIYDFFKITWDSIRLGYYVAKRTFFVIVLFRRAHPSPNSGYPESAIAGALGVRLGGPSYYGGVLVDKPFIGVSSRPLSVEVAEEGLKIVGLAAILAGISSVLVRL